MYNYFSFREGFVSTIEGFDENNLYGVNDPEAPMEEIVADYASRLEGCVGGGDPPAPDMVRNFLCAGGKF